MANKKITVAVSGLNAIDSPGPGVAVIRSLKDSKQFDVRIIGLSYDALEPGIYLRNIVDKTYQIPLPSAGSDALKTRLAYINDIEKIDVIIPNFDAELYNFIKIAGDLDVNWKIKSFLPSIKQFESISKLNLYGYGKEHGLSIPHTRAIYSIDEITYLTNDFIYPVVIKGKYYEAYIAYTAEQAHKYFHKIAAKWGLPIIVQEFIHGTEVNVVGLGNGNGKNVAKVPMRKMYITDKGKAWAGITIEDEELLALADKFVAEAKWRGGYELEVMRTDTGKLYIMEINPRLPAWIYLAVGAGQNIPELLVKLSLGKKINPFTKYKTGTLFIRYSWDLITDINEFQTISTLGEL